MQFWLEEEGSARARGSPLGLEAGPRAGQRLRRSVGAAGRAARGRGARGRAPPAPGERRTAAQRQQSEELGARAGARTAAMGVQ